MQKIIQLTEQEYEELLEFQRKFKAVSRELHNLYNISYNSLSEEQIRARLVNERCGDCVHGKDACYYRDLAEYGKPLLDDEGIKFADCQGFQEV